MLSIQLDSDNEWWVNGRIFERLFRTALDDGIMPPHLEKWLHVTNASGGLDLTQDVEPPEAAKLIAALRTTAERDVKRFKDADPKTMDGDYRVGLERFLAMQAEGKR